MKVELRNVKSVIVKSNIPDVDYVINPYIGCQHGCIYCYAEFMIRFTGHKGDKWGTFLDVKNFDFNKIKPSKYNGKSILLSSVTDPYIPLELKYKNTRKILQKLIGTKARIIILTKSKRVIRDIDLFKKFENIEVGISICTLDKEIAKLLEPGASRPIERLNAIKVLYENGIKPYVFISPYFPGITNFREILKESMDYASYFMFENLNFRPHNIPRIFSMIKQHFPDLLPIYNGLKDDHSYWDKIEEEIENFCLHNNLNYKIEFHHGGFSKS
ncbi:MAG: radical SAM protein [Candidatus Thorarchaeota archaeon]